MKRAPERSAIFESQRLFFEALLNLFLAEMFFFDGRQMKHNCFQFGLRSDVGASFETAIQDSESVETYEEVGEVFVPRIGDMRVKN